MINKKDTIVAAQSFLILYQAVSKTNTPLKLWIACTSLDCIFRYPLPSSVLFHHVAGLLTTGTILYKRIEHPHKYKFIMLESTFISAYLLQKNNFSDIFKLVHLIVHIFIRWPILLKGINVLIKLEYPLISKLGYCMFILDVYWLFKALRKREDEIITS